MAKPRVLVTRRWPEAVEAALRPLAEAAAARLIAVRVRLRGETPAHDRLAADREGLTAEIQAAAHRIHLQGSRFRGDIARAAEQGDVHVPTRKA